MKKKVLNIFSILATAALGLAASNATAQIDSAYNAPGKYIFKVPVGVTTLTVDVVGGVGGKANSVYNSPPGGGTGGAAGEVKATIAVNPGDIDTIYVAQNGPSTISDGITLGGSGYGTGGGQSKNGDGGGGGASAIINTTGSPLIVAGGGGGGGINYGGTSGGIGGFGGSVNGNGTNGQSGDNDGVSGGFGATQSAVGVGGTGYSGQGGSGNSANGGSPPNWGGGAGGAGYYGGGSGQFATISPYDAGGGGGGSSFADPSTNNPVYSINNAGTPYVALSYNLQGSALNFDGNNNYVSVADNAALDFGTGDFTVEASVQLNGSQNDYSGLVAKANSGVNVGWQMVVVGNSIAAEISDGNNFFGAGDGLQGGTNLNDGKWHHLAMVVSRVLHTVTLYVDGIADATLSNAAIGNMNITDADPLLMGCDRELGTYFNGNEDEVRIWNRALCTQELVNDTNGELQLPQTGLVAYYKFNQGFAALDNSAIATLVDSSGNGFNGALNNFVLTAGTTSNFILPGVTANGNYAPVFATPTVKITGAPLCQGTTSYSLTASGNNITSYLWSDGSTSSASSVFNPATVNGDTIAVTGSTGCMVYAAKAIIMSRPAASAINIATYASSYTFKGNTETASGHYTFDTLSATGCDSMVNLYLTIYNTPVLSGSCAPSALKVSTTPSPEFIQWKYNGNVYATDTAKWDTGAVIAQNGIANAGYGIAIDTAGNIYVNNNTTDVVMYPKNSTPATKGVVVARNGISFIHDIRVDIAGNIFVLDEYNDQVYEYASGSDSTTVPVTVASGFNSPQYMFVDNADNVYVSDANNECVWYYPVGDTVGTIVAQTGLSNPEGLYVDNVSNLYVSDYSNNNVTEYPKGSNASTIGTIVAQGNMPYITNPDGVFAITVDGNGYIYAMAESQNNLTANDSAIVYIFAPGSNQNTPAIDSIMMPGMFGSYYMATGANGNFYVSTTSGDYVKKFGNTIKMTDSITIGGKYTAFVTSFTGAKTKTFSELFGARTESAINIGTYATSFNFKGNTEIASGHYTFDTTNVSGCDSVVNLYLTLYAAPNIVTSSTCAPTNLTLNANPLPVLTQWKQNGNIVAIDTAKWDAGTVVAYNGIGSDLYTLAIDTAGNVYAGFGTEVLKFAKGANATTPGVIVAKKGIAGVEDIRVDVAGNIFVEDLNNYQVYKYPANSNASTAPTLVASGFGYPQYLFVDNADNVYVSDYDNSAVWYFAAGDTIGTIIAQNGLSEPAGMYVNNSGNLFVADYSENEVLEYPKGSNSTTAGTVIAAKGFTSFGTVSTIDFDGNGYLYAQAYRGSPDSNIIYIYPQGTTATTAPVDSILLPHLPSGYEFTLDASGNVYALSDYDSYIREYKNVVKMTDSAKTAGSYTAVVNSFSGSQITTNALVIGAPDTSILTKVACDSYTLNGTQYTSGGTFTQVLANKSGCDSTITLNLTVNTTPTVTVTGKDTVLLGGNDTLKASGATTYTWTTGGTNDTIIVSPSTPTTYTVTGTSNGCSSNTSFTVDVEITTGVQAIANGGSVNLYPNPANTYVNISIENGQLAMNGEVSIYNEAGKQVTPSFVIRNSQFVIDINDLAAGVYFVRINTATQSQVVRFIKSK